MTRTTKVCAIFFISSLWLVLMRIAFGFSSLSDNVSDWLFSFSVQIVGMGIIPLTLYKLWVKGDIRTGFRLKAKLPPLTYVLAVVLGFLMSYLTTGISVIWQTVLRALGYTHVNSVGTIYSDAGVLVMALLTTAVLPGIFEELTDRGLVLNMLEGIEDEKTVVVLVGLLFGLAHQNIVQTGYAFVGGMVFAFLALKTKSVFPGMIIHFMNNAFSVIGEYSSQTSGLLARIEDGFYGFINGHFFLAIVTWIGAGVAVVFILKLIAWLQPPEIKSEGDVYFYPNKNFYVDELFGPTLKRDELATVKPKARLYEYAFLFAAVAMMVLTTLFTFMWGVWR